MRFWILLTSLFLSFSCYADDWMDRRISEDLAPFAKESLDPTTFTSQEFVGAVFVVENSKAKITKQTPSLCNTRLNIVLNYLNSLGKRAKLPDVCFVLSPHDGISFSTPIPIFTFAKSKQATGAILFPDFEACEKPDKGHYPKLCKKYPWKKKNSKGFFRGATTGKWSAGPPPFNNSRAQAVELSYLYPNLLDANFSYFSPEVGPILEEFKAWMRLIGKSPSSRSVEDHYKYRYLLDIDGNSCTYSRFRWILFSNSTPVKVLSNNIQWYYGALTPFEHYVPVQEDLSDFVEVIHFLKQHDKEAQQIAQNGQEIARKIFSQEKLDEYVLKLLWAYSERLK